MSNNTPSQNYIFRLHSSGEANVQLECWQRSRKITSTQLSAVTDSIKAGAGKVATSVPTPFARMHLFETAFNILSTPESNGKYQFVGNTIYHQLVSDCLDMFQLLFTSGNNKSIIRIEEWNKFNQLILLKGRGPNHPHTLLADTLEMFIDRDATGAMAGLDNVYLIYYKDILVGGSSPLTVFFTSANWHREMVGLPAIKSTTDDVLFDKDYAALHQRDPEFIEFMCKFHLAYQDTLSRRCKGFDKYLRDNIEQFAPDFNRKKEREWDNYRNNPSALANDYQLVNTGGGNTSLSIMGINVYQQTGGGGGDIEQTSDFVIASTVDYYRSEHGFPEPLKKPLVLVNGMNVPGTYIKSPWDPNTTVFYRGEALSQRMLPGQDIIYPYLTTDDFLSDQLVRLPFKINSDKFLTGNTGDMQYLLPIKKEYFKYFKPEDLTRQLKITSNADGSLSVELNIPIRNNRSISFSKRYDSNHEHKINTRIGIGVFPFYKITNCDSRIAELNEYSVLLADKTDGDSAVELQFLNFKNINPQIDNYTGKIKDVKSSNRTVKGSTPSSKFYSVPSEFDAIEVSINGYSGLIVPKFDIINYESTNHSKFTFAIDFGTSNTHIAFTSPNNNTPVAFSIGESDKQMILLNEPDKSKTGSEKYNYGFGDLPQMKTIVQREFVPSLIGKENQSEILFPTRTATCEIAGFDSQTQNDLFGSLNIGFSIDAEETVLSSVVYTTNLKWLYEKRQNSKDADRLYLYYKEIFWLIKNKVIKNGGNINDLKILWLLPESADSTIYSPNWEKAVSEVFKSFRSVFEPEPVKESVAPYFYLRKASSLGAQAADAMNIDIGGGTTDVMYFMPKQNRYLSTSFRFAGNDIWGEGINDDKAKNNGFILNFLKKYQNNTADKNKPEDFYLDKSMKDTNLGSDDVIALLFKYDEHFKFLHSMVLGNPDLLLILYLHYGAIIYHLVQFFESQGLEIPRYITFSGKGSQYINIMCPPSDITRFTTYLLKAFSEKSLPAGFKVVLSDNPKEATANGAILFDREKDTPSGLKIGFDNTDSIVHYGNKNELAISLRKTSSYKEISEEIANSVIANAATYVEKMFASDDIILYLNSKRLTRMEDIKKWFSISESPELKDSYDAAMMGKNGSSEMIKETLFFYPFKNSLYGLGRHLAGEN